MEATTATTTESTTTAAPGTTETTTTQAQAAPVNNLEFIPEAYRNDPSFSKYTNQDEFFKGVQNLTKLVGQKQIVTGIQLPGDDAKPEDVENFYKAIGRPESADKYTLPEKIEGIDVDISETRKSLSNMAFKAGLNQKQAEAVFKEYMNEMKPMALADAKKAAFPEDTEVNFELANKGAKAAGLLDKIESSGYGRDPLFLQLCAELGKLTGEGSFERNSDAPSSKATLLEEARQIQMSDAYIANDKEAHRKVEAIFKKVYG